MTRETFDRFRRLEQLPDLRRSVAQRSQLGDALERLFDGQPAGARGDQFRDAIHIAERDAQGSTRVANRRARRHRSEGHDLRDVILPVLVGDVADHFVAPLDAEIGVDVGHRDPVGIEEALEDQAELDGVEAGDVQDVRHDRTGCRATPRTDRNVVVACVLDEIPYDQEVRGEAHRANDAEFVVEAFAQGRIVFRALLAVAFDQSPLAEFPQVRLRRLLTE